MKDRRIEKRGRRKKARMQENGTPKQCHGKTRHGLRCSKRGTHLFGFYCHQHRHQLLKSLGKAVGAVLTVMSIVAFGLALKSRNLERRLRCELQRIRASMPDSLEERYPFGYCLIGLSGDKRVFMPSASASTIHIDWPSMEVKRTSRFLADVTFPAAKVGGADISRNTVGLLLRPGQRQSVIVAGEYVAYVQCIRVSPTTISLLAAIRPECEDETGSAAIRFKANLKE